MQTLNVIQITDNIASSGQPNKKDLYEIASLGYSTIVNLAVSTSENAISNEGDIVTELGMSYVHIPVEWEQPSSEQFDIFSAVMQQQNERKVWVHCALNMRVSAFLYLYSLKYLDISEQLALKNLHAVWQPNEIWLNFIRAVRESF